MTSLIATTPIPSESAREFYQLESIVNKLKQWKQEKEREPIEDMINRSLMELEYGSDGSAKSEELLQLPSSNS